MSMQIQFKEPVFFVPGETNIIDTVVKNKEGQYIGEFSREVLSDVAKRYPGAEIGEFDIVLANIEKLLITDPIKITEEEYGDALDVLPPENWVVVKGSESFKMCEYTSGRVTAIFARRGSLYFTFQDIASLSHESIMAKVNLAFPKQ